MILINVNPRIRQQNYKFQPEGTNNEGLKVLDRMSKAFQEALHSLPHLNITIKYSSLKKTA